MIGKNIKNWYNKIPINPTLKTALFLTVTTSVVIGVGYLGYKAGQKFIVKRKWNKEVDDTMKVLNESEKEPKNKV